MPGRRSLIALGACLLAPSARAEARLLMQVWRDPDCGCCHLWIPHLQAAGFEVQDNRVRALAGWRRMLGVPSDLLSCHVARVGGVAIEGHVPPLAIRRLLAEQPPGVRGLAVPGMPIGSPGMEVPGREPETYDVIAFGTGPHRPFMRFRGTEPV